MRAATLQSAGDIRAVFAARRVAHGRHLGVHARRRQEGGTGRSTTVAGRRVGNAVTRNRAKRRLRAVVRQVGVPDATDIIVVAKASSVSAPYQDLVDEYRMLLARLHRHLEPTA